MQHTFSKQNEKTEIHEIFANLHLMPGFFALNTLTKNISFCHTSP